ncbi:solute carrier family 13 member 3 [Rhincodon typus]|uniref:solute carrier family 13 member 3 n=1 Tax=Rhincodon typus TaxID=259920 RepID=UPI00202F8BA9|nr:solute carrier family 13 member 3 [Rhincodon typus]
MKNGLLRIWSLRHHLILILAPFVFLPVVFLMPPKEGKCLYLILIIATFWCTEALPLAVTSLLPISLFPLFGVLPSSKTCPMYFLDTNVLFFGGLILAVAIEDCNLHRRVALAILGCLGVNPLMLILGIMLTTALLSMWLSNTATTAMMMPIATAVLKRLYDESEAVPQSKYVTDAVVAMTVVFLMFIFPSQKPSLKWKTNPEEPVIPHKPLLTWKNVQHKVAWNVIILLGGGFAIAKACEESGLSRWIGNKLRPLEHIPASAIVLTVSLVISSFTEFASNTATSIIFLPILAELGVRAKNHPLYLMIPGAVSCSFAFMLPVATPPNAIAFATGQLKVKDMATLSCLSESEERLMGILQLSNCGG